MRSPLFFCLEMGRIAHLPPHSTRPTPTAEKASAFPLGRGFFTPPPVPEEACRVREGTRWGNVAMLCGYTP